MTTAELNQVQTQFGSEKIFLVLLDGEPYGWVSIEKGSDVFGRIVQDRKAQLEQDLGHSITESARVTEDGGMIVEFESKTRSYIFSGMRRRCELKLRKLSNLKELPF